VTHGQLPTGPVVRALVLQALSTQDVARPALPYQLSGSDSTA
jgi:hypothetical protein